MRHLVVEIPDIDIRAACTLAQAHAESHKSAPDIRRLEALLYEAIHRCHSHGVAWAAAGHCYRRVGMADRSAYAFQMAADRGVQP